MLLFFFYLSHGLVQVCEIEELSHMGKNNRNPDLVCEKDLSHMGKTTEFLIWCARKMGILLDCILPLMCFVFTCSLMSLSPGAMVWAVICA